MDEYERRHRWRDASLYDRFDMVFGKPSPPSDPKPGPSMRDLIGDAPILSAEEYEQLQHDRRTAEAMIEIENALAEEKAEADQAQRDAHAEFRQSAIGQLLKG